ncbi:MAG: hydrogenase expression/formation protein HypE [Candidatus Nanopelagicales bacterium]|nr:hydrogenase expression/formation protein HypE [Candidatus Nanopelagicales bacterium]
MTQRPDFDNWTCPLPLRDQSAIVMGHGGGGRLSGELVEHLFMPAFAGAPLSGVLEQLGDAAVLDLEGSRLAFTTDSYVVRPRFFPGGNVGDLAVNGTVNDLSVSGAVPLALSAGMILEEGMPLDELGVIAETMGRAAREAGVSIVTGDTKVVDSGHGDGVYINTAGIGVVRPGLQLGPAFVAPGDQVLISGPIAAHGIAVLSVRDGLEFGSQIVTDSQPLNGLIAQLLDSGAQVSMMRDPTRGGVAATLNEIAGASGAGIEIVESAVPVPEDVRAACAFLGLDPLLVANEGRVVVVVRGDDADLALETMRSHPAGSGAARIGQVVADHPGVVVARTGIGGTRIVDLPLAEQLPRIC